MAEILEDLIGTTASSLTPWGCARNCVVLIVSGLALYVILVVIFVIVQAT